MFYVKTRDTTLRTGTALSAVFTIDCSNPWSDIRISISNTSHGKSDAKVVNGSVNCHMKTMSIWGGRLGTALLIR